MKDVIDVIYADRTWTGMLYPVISRDDLRDRLLRLQLARHTGDCDNCWVLAIVP